jgi:hypothetical protein
MFRIKPTEFWPGKECTHTLFEAKATIHNTNWPYRMLYNLSICGLFCFVKLRSPSQYYPLHSWYCCPKPSTSRGVHGGRFIMFRLIMQEVLNVQQFCCWEFNKIKMKNLREIGGPLLVLLESAQWVRFCRGVFVNF